MTKKKIPYKYLLSVAFLVLISVFTVSALLKEVDISKTKDLLFSVDLIYVILGMLMIVVYFACEGMALRVFVNSLGQKTSLKRTYVYGCINSFYSLITPFGSGGQPFTIYYMMHDGIPGSKVSIATLLNLLEYKLVLLVYTVLIVVLKPAYVFAQGGVVIALFIFGAIVNVAMVFIIALSMVRVQWVRSLGGFVYRLLAKLGIVKSQNLEMRIANFNSQVDEYRNGADHIKHHPTIFIRAFLYNLLRQTAFFMISYFVYLSFGLDPSRWLDVIIIQALIYIMVDSLPIPGGVGATEALFVLLFGMLYPDNTMMTSAVLLTRMINYVFAIIFGGVFAFGKQISVMKGTKKNA